MDILEYGRFGVRNLSVALSNEPFVPGQVGATGLFEEEGITTTFAEIEYMDSELRLIEPTNRGGPGETTGDPSRGIVPVSIPHYQRDDAVKADAVQNVRAFGREEDLETLENHIQKKNVRHGRDLTLTIEHQRVGTLKGLIATRSGRVLVNLFQLFGIAVPAVFNLDATDQSLVLGKFFDDTRRTIEDDFDLPYNKMQWLTGDDLHSWIWNQPQVRETFLGTASAGTLRAGTPDVFEFGNFIFERYRTGKKARTDLGSDYIASDEGRLMISGVPDLYKTWFAPADYVETVNTEGLPFYAKMIEQRNGKGYDLEIQSNPLSICTRPQALRKLKLQNL